MSRLLAIDPASNKTGLAFFIDEVLVATKTITSDGSTPLARRLSMASKIEPFIETVDKISTEEPHLMGVNANGMNRLLGYIEFMTKGKITMVHPMTLKKFTGSGSSDKLEMALAIGQMLKTDQEQEILANAIIREAWDETDAVAVGLWALQQ